MVEEELIVFDQQKAKVGATTKGMADATTTGMERRALHVLESVYDLRYPEEMIASFKSSKHGSYITCTYDDGFILECPYDRQEEVYRDFVSVLQTYIKDGHAEKAKDVFEVPKLSRKLGTARIENSERVTIGVGHKANTNSICGGKKLLIPQLIAHQTVTKTFETSENLSSLLLKKLENHTGSNIAVDSISKNIVVKGDTEEDVQIILCKLRVIAEQACRQRSERLTFDFYISEKEFLFKVLFHRSRQRVDRLFSQQYPGFAGEYFEVFMVRWNGDDLRYHRVQSNARMIESANTSFPLWSGYVHPVQGEPRPITDIPTPATIQTPVIPPTRGVDLVGDWNQHIPANVDDLDDPFEQRKMPRDEDTPDSLNKEWKKTKRVILEQDETLFPENLRTALVPTRVKPPPILPPLMPRGLGALSRFETPPMNQCESIVPWTDRAAPTITTHSLLDDLVPPNFQIPINDPEFLLWKTAGANVRDDGVQTRSDPHVSELIVETQQTRSEEETREYKQSQRLMKLPVTGDEETTDFVQDATEAISFILDMTRSINGRVSMQVNVGRALVRSEEVHKDFRGAAFSINEWPVIFHTKKATGSASTIFSNVLTDSWMDVEFLLGLRRPGGGTLFTKVPVDQKVLYRFEIYDDRSQRKFILDIDDQGNRIIGTRGRRVGAATCHFLKRAWDASFAVTASYEPEEDIKMAMNSMADSVSVSGGTNPVIEIKSSDSHMLVSNIAIRRETTHLNHGSADLALHITEVQDLSVEEIPNHIYRAFASSDESAIMNGRLWWEASVSSTEVDQMLKENESLEIGEVALWSVEDLAKSNVIANLLDLTQQMVTRMDSIGFRLLRASSDLDLSGSHSVTGKSKGTRSMTKEQTASFVLPNWSYW